jgi:hypothetical protein
MAPLSVAAFGIGAGISFATLGGSTVGGVNVGADPEHAPRIAVDMATARTENDLASPNVTRRPLQLRALRKNRYRPEAIGQPAFHRNFLRVEDKSPVSASTRWQRIAFQRRCLFRADCVRVESAMFALRSPHLPDSVTGLL